MGNPEAFAGRLYLVQHGEAKREEEDPERPLTERGREAVARVARFVASTGAVQVDRIVHSGKRRARQTAEILAEHLRPREGLSTMEGLAPKDDPSIAAARIAQAPESLLLVGHLPHLSRLAGLLLAGNPEATPIRFRMGGIVALDQDDKGTWSVAWAIVPDLVPG